MASVADLETAVVRFSAQDFIDNPALYAKVEDAWRNAAWVTLFGELPVGAVLATLDDGITFHYKRMVTPPPAGRG